jgi:hypothetical protein
MSIVINREMFFSLSISSQQEIISRLITTSVNNIKDLFKEVPNSSTASAFESASLTFGNQLVLPDYNSANRLTNKTRRMASDVPIAKATDLYRVVSDEQIKNITEDIDTGFFINNSSRIDWSKGARFNPNNWDVKRIIMKVKISQPMTSLQIDQSLPTMDRYRVTSILRELRKQGILIVN